MDTVQEARLTGVLTIGHASSTCRCSSKLWIAADEVRRIVNTPAARVLGYLWIGTKRPAPKNFSVCSTCRNNPAGGDAAFNPINQRSHHVSCLRPNAAPTVQHPWHHKQTKKVVCCGPHDISHAITVVDADERVDLRLCPPVIHDEFSTPRAETREVRVRCVEQRAARFQQVDVAIRIKSPPIELLAWSDRILEEAREPGLLISPA